MHECQASDSTVFLHSNFHLHGVLTAHRSKVSACCYIHAGAFAKSAAQSPGSALAPTLPAKRQHVLDRQPVQCICVMQTKHKCTEQARISLFSGIDLYVHWGLKTCD